MVLQVQDIDGGPEKMPRVSEWKALEGSLRWKEVEKWSSSSLR